MRAAIRYKIENVDVTRTTMYMKHGGPLFIKYFYIWSEEPFTAYDPFDNKWFQAEWGIENGDAIFSAMYSLNDVIKYAWMCWWKNHD